MLGDQLLALLDEGDATGLVASIASALKSTTPPKALERAAALHIWKRTWDKEHPNSRRGGDRKSAGNVGVTFRVGPGSDGAVSAGSSEEVEELKAEVEELKKEVRALKAK